MQIRTRSRCHVFDPLSATCQGKEKIPEASTCPARRQAIGHGKSVGNPIYSGERARFASGPEDPGYTKTGEVQGKMNFLQECHEEAKAGRGVPRPTERGTGEHKQLSGVGLMISPQLSYAFAQLPLWFLESRSAGLGRNERLHPFRHFCV